MKAAMFANGSGIVGDTDIWHKRIGHVNMQRLKLMQNKEIVTGLPKFKVEGMRRKSVKRVNSGSRHDIHFHMTNM